MQCLFLVLVFCVGQPVTSLPFEVLLVPEDSAAIMPAHHFIQIFLFSSPEQLCSAPLSLGQMWNEYVCLN